MNVILNTFEIIAVILFVCWLFKVGFMKRIWNHAIDYSAKKIATFFVGIITILIIILIFNLVSK